MKLVKLRPVILAVLVCASAPATALASTTPKPYVPAGNSAANQYVEVVPTAGGGSSTEPITQHKGGTAAGVTATGSPLTPTVRAALHRRGRDGAGATAFAAATAPASVRHRSRAHAAAAVPSGGSGSPGSGGGGASPSSGGGTSLLGSVTGSGSGGGLGRMLPIALGLSAVIVGAAALRRRRGA